MPLSQPLPFDDVVPKTLAEIKTKYGDIFEDLGTLPGYPYYINPGPTIPPK